MLSVAHRNDLISFILAFADNVVEDYIKLAFGIFEKIIKQTYSLIIKYNNAISLFYSNQLNINNTHNLLNIDATGSYHLMTVKSTGFFSTYDRGSFLRNVLRDFPCKSKCPRDFSGKNTYLNDNY